MAQKTYNLDDNSFDYFRLVFAFTIFLGHFITHFQVDSVVLSKVAYFVRGVPVFFLLSGIFTAQSLEKYSPKAFLVRRFFRIYPALYFCIILNTIIILFVYNVKPGFLQAGIYLLTQFTVAQFYTGGWLRGYGVGVPNGVLWTICADIQYYFVALLFGRKWKDKTLSFWGTVIGICIIVSYLIELAGDNQLIPETIYKLLSVSVIPFLYIFFAGMAVYYHKDRIIPFCVKHLWIFASAYVVWDIMPTSIKKHFDLVRFNGITTILLIFLIVGLGYRFGKHRLRTDYSYAFYLYHMVVINLVYHCFTKEVETIDRFVIVFLGCIAATVFLTLFSVHVVEKKIAMPLEKRLIKRTVSR